jgi:hypothetical protein
MPSSTAADWPSPGRFALALIIGLALTLAAAWLWGTALIEAILPTTRIMLGWIDDRFGIVSLGLEQGAVVRLRTTPTEMFIMGGRVVEAHPQGWLEVGIYSGAVLRVPLIAPAIAASLPGTMRVKALSFVLATLLAFGFLLLDLPTALFANVWKLIVEHLEPGRFSPLLIWHEFLLTGGRFGVAAILGLAGWRLARKAA